MTLSPYLQEVAKHHTFAIISHPDTSKTTITKKVLLFRQAIQTTSTVKGHGSNQHTKSDWMEMEKQHGISITTSVMQFPYHNCLVNLLNTPGHKDFSEDTYHTLTAVDCCLMVINTTKGVEDHTHKLMEVTHLRNTPILTFMNKLDHDIHDPMELLNEVENKLKISCAPITWPIGCSKLFKGIYHLYKDKTYLYQSSKGHTIQEVHIVKGLNNPDLNAAVGEDLAQQLHDKLELVKGTSNKFNKELFLAGKITPVFFSTALGNFSINHMLDGLVEWAPAPMPRQTDTHTIEASKDKFTSFIFKIQANMDPKHHDHVAFMHVVSSKYEKGMKLRQVHTAKDVVISNTLTFMAGDHSHIEEAYPGNILSLHNHSTIQISNTFTQGEMMKFTSIPNFTPELFHHIHLKDPLKQKQLLKGLVQLSKEGTVQVFHPISNNNLIIGAVGVLQFDVVVAHLKSKYNIEAVYESVNIATAHWVECADTKKFKEFKHKNKSQLALDGSNNLAYITTSMVNLRLAQEHYPDIQFHQTHEH